ncbi:MAG: hypothetical protein ACTHYC_09715 [Sphingobacterium sp.]
MINYHNRTFRGIDEASSQTNTLRFRLQFRQIGKVIIAEFSSHDTPYGQLLGQFTEYGVLALHYHRVDENGLIDYGRCTIYPQTTMAEQLTIRLQGVSIADERIKWELVATETASV